MADKKCISQVIKQVGRPNYKQKKGKKQKKQGVKLSRSQRIKSKRLIYPLSTPDKIVFISNELGVGFRKEDLEDLGCPCYIPIDMMLKQINAVCYHQCKTHLKYNKKKYYGKCQLLFQLALAILTILTIIYCGLISATSYNNIQSYNLVFSIFIVVLITGMVGMALLASLEKKQKEESLDNKLVQRIKQKLSQFNANQIQLYADQARFKWTCHKDCLWVALNVL